MVNNSGAKAPTASEVARMFNPDNSGFQRAMENISQLDAQRRMHNDQMQLQKESQMNQVDADVAKKLSTSGTYNDFYTIPKSQESMKKLAQMKKDNPNWNASDYRMAADAEMAGLVESAKTAGTADKMINDMVSVVEKEHPIVDKAKYKTDLQRKVYFGDDGKPLPKPNVDALFSSDYDVVNNEEAALRYTNNNTLDKNVRESISKQFQPQPKPIYGVSDPNGISANVTHYMTPFQRVSADGRNVEPDFVPVQVGEITYSALPADKANLLPATREFNIAKKMERKNLASSDPAFNDLPEETQNRIVAANIINKYGGTEANKKSDWDFEGARIKNTQEQQRISNSMAQERLNLARQSNTRANEKMEIFRKANKANEYANKYADVIGSMLTDDNGAPLSKEAAEQMKPFQVEPTMPITQAAMPFLSKDAQAALQFNPNGKMASKFLDVHDISAASPAGFFTDKKTMKKFKAISVKDKISGDNVIVREYIYPDENKNMQVSGYEVVPANKVKTELSGYQQDFRVPEKAYDAACLISSEDFE